MKHYINPALIDLVQKIKSRKDNTGTSDFIDTINKQGIQFASGNGMNVSELTDFLKKTEQMRK